MRDYALVVNPHISYVPLSRHDTRLDAKTPEVEPVGPSQVQPGPELPVSYSSPGAPARADLRAPKWDGSWFEPTKITAVEQPRGVIL